MAVKQVAKKPGTAVANWEEQLAAEAVIAAKQEEGTSTGQFFGLKAGQLTWQSQPVIGNRMAVIILDSILENVYYEGSYDPDVIQAPACYAFGRDEKLMTPHEKVVEAKTAQHEQCKGCQWNEFGSAEKGKGKACRNTRRLAMIVAGSFDKKGELTLIEDVEHFETVQIGFMKLPVTSTKGFSAYVKTISAALKRPPHGIITEVSVVPDGDTQFKVLFEAISNVPNELMGAIMARNAEAKSVIEFPYSPVEEREEKPKTKPQSRGAQKPVAKGRKY